MANKKKVCGEPGGIAAVEDKIRDLINRIKVMNEEELEIGEGKKVENDAAEEIIAKLREIAALLGKSVK